MYIRLLVWMFLATRGIRKEWLSQRPHLYVRDRMDELNLPTAWAFCFERRYHCLYRSRAEYIRKKDAKVRM